MQDRITARSSTCSATCGYQSETQRPLSPWRAHFRWDGISVLCAVPGMAVSGLPNDSGMGWPAYFSSAGLGSKVSMWLGPPSMKHQMTDLAVGLWWGSLEASGSRAAALSAPRAARAIDPRPPAAWERNALRDLSAISSVVFSRMSIPPLWPSRPDQFL